MNLNPADPKAGERAYYVNIGPEGLKHAAGKPFSDPRCGIYLLDIGALLQLLEPPPRRVLDLGCGTGWTSRFLGKVGYEVTGLDISPEAVETARRLAEAEQLTAVQFLLGDYESFAAAGDYDYVLFYDALHHAEDERTAIATAWRALKPSGAMICFEPGSGHSRSKSSRRAIEEFGVHEKDMPPRKIAQLGRQAGFKRWLFLPSPHDVSRGFYGRDFRRASNRWQLFGEKAWGIYRTITRLFNNGSRGGVTVMWK